MSAQGGLVPHAWAQQSWPVIPGPGTKDSRRAPGGPAGRLHRRPFSRKRVPRPSAETRRRRDDGRSSTRSMLPRQPVDPGPRPPSAAERGPMTRRRLPLHVAGNQGAHQPAASTRRLDWSRGPAPPTPSAVPPGYALWRPFPSASGQRGFKRIPDLGKNSGSLSRTSHPPRPGRRSGARRARASPAPTAPKA